MTLPLLERFGKQICPYCFEPFRLRDTPFRCSSPDAVCSPEVDPIRESFWQENAPLGKVLESDGKLVQARTCDSCKRASRQRICPACHMDLPHTMGQFRSLIFAVIGAKESGKSHYMAVLIDRIRKDLGPRMGMLLEELDDATIRRYREIFHRPLFEQRQAIRGTISALADRQVALPLVYSLTFRGHGAFGGQRIRSVVNLVFFDTAGEDLDDEDVMATVNKYVYRSDGVILLLDPLQLPKVRERLAPKVDLPRINTETRDILNRVTRLIRKGRELSPRKQIEAPLAVTFSKFDAVEKLVDPQMQLLHEARHEGGFDEGDFAAVHAEMMTLLSQWDGEEIANQAETNYRTFGFFGLSALGMNPGNEQKVPLVTPRRVEDPFLWLLYRHGLLRARDGSSALPLWKRLRDDARARVAASIVALLLLGGVGVASYLEPAPRAHSPAATPVVAPVESSVTAPVTLTSGIRLRNETESGQPLGDFATGFRSRDVRFLAFHVSLAPTAGAVSGWLRVRLLDPEGRLMASSGQTESTIAEYREVDSILELSQRFGVATHSVFVPGPYTLELWWDDHKLGAVELQMEGG